MSQPHTSLAWAAPTSHKSCLGSPNLTQVNFKRPQAESILIFPHTSHAWNVPTSHKSCLGSPNRTQVCFKRPQAESRLIFPQVMLENSQPPVKQASTCASQTLNQFNHIIPINKTTMAAVEKPPSVAFLPPANNIHNNENNNRPTPCSKPLPDNTTFINSPLLRRKVWPIFDYNRAFMASAISAHVCNRDYLQLPNTFLPSRRH